MTKILLEAESFRHYGGWVVDQQSIRQMGSAYLMAHGMGIPVDDATTEVEISENANWTFWVRTRNWTAAWGRGTPGGSFQLGVNGHLLPSILGTNGVHWDWQKAGTIPLKKASVTLALHDLTGFNGRCDAIYITNDNDVPPNESSDLASFREKMLDIKLTEDPKEYDLVVIGGGVAGLCTAISAIRLGLNVAMIHDREIIGGCNSSDIRVSLGGVTHAEPYLNLGNVVGEIAPIMGSGATYAKEYYEDARKRNIFYLSPSERYKLMLSESALAVERDSNRIIAVISQNIKTGQKTRTKGKLFADCTGDAVIARMMDAEVMYGTEDTKRFNESLAPEVESNQVMGHSVIWYSKKSDEVTIFPAIDWGYQFSDDTVYPYRHGDWEWESGQYRNQAEETEYIRDFGLMTIYANWSYLKNHYSHKDEWACDTLDWVSPIGGKRESYRVVGDLILTQNDIERQVEYPDKSGAMTWNIDLHYPDPDNEDKFPEPFRSCAYHRGIGHEYAVPYRCLYARDVDNLFLGGRIISVSHVAFACVRVMRTLGTLGEVIGMAAKVCTDNSCNPRMVYEEYLSQLIELMQEGIPVPLYHGSKCNETESYHFKEHGFFNVYPKFNIPVEDKKLCKRIKRLNVKHKHEHPKF